MVTEKKKKTAPKKTTKTESKTSLKKPQKSSETPTKKTTPEVSLKTQPKKPQKSPKTPTKKTPKISQPKNPQKSPKALTPETSFETPPQKPQKSPEAPVEKAPEISFETPPKKPQKSPETPTEKTPPETFFETPPQNPQKSPEAPAEKAPEMSFETPPPKPQKSPEAPTEKTPPETSFETPPQKLQKLPEAPTEKAPEISFKTQPKKLSKNNIAKIIIIAILAIAFVAVIAFVVALRASEDENGNGGGNSVTPVSAKKENTQQETVYVNLDSFGALESVTVIDGRGKQVAVSEIAIPWDISIEYYLDGKSASPTEIAGKSGAFALKLNIDKNESFKGSKSFYDGFALQASFSASTEIFSSATVESGVIAQTGKNISVSFTCIPGKAGEFSFSAAARNFEMPDINIAGTAYEMDFGGISEDSVTELLDASQQLSDGADKFYDGIKDNAVATVRELEAAQERIAKQGTGNIKKEDILKLESGADALSENIETMEEMTDGLMRLYPPDSELQQYFGGVKALLAPQKKFNSQVSKLADKLIDMVSENPTSDFSKMLDDYKSEAQKLPAAFLEYKKGINEFNAGIKELGNIDISLEKWNPVSFSGKVKNAERVVFAMKAKGVTIPKTETKAPEKKELSVGEKIKNLLE
jgi:hypothetical protein